MLEVTESNMMQEIQNTEGRINFKKIRLIFFLITGVELKESNTNNFNQLVKSINEITCFYFVQV